MSLTSYRAAPPRVTTSAAPHLLRHGDTTEETSMQDTWLGKPVPVYPHRCLGLGSTAAFRRINVGRCDPSNSPISAKPLPADRVDQTGLDGL